MAWLALLLSAALHLAVILLALHQPKPPQKPVPVAVLGGHNIEFVPTGDPESTPDGPGNNGAVYERECDGTRYNGIGILHNWLGVITSVHPQGPARKAGIRVGDSLIGFARVSEAEVTVEIERDGVTFTLAVQTADLCYREVESEVIPRRGQ